MNARFALLIFGLLLAPVAFSQLNMSLVGHLDYQALHNSNLNDCWGYVDETGIEYALVGTTKGTSVVSLADPANPVEVFWEPGTQSIWRDLQVYGDYAYITTEADDGLLIIDMSPLPASSVLPTTYYFGPSGNGWTSAHDIFIDTTGGWAYICGANRGNGGLIILDIHTDPLHPVEVGIFDPWYCHDAFAQGNRLYGAHIGEGFLSVSDNTDHANPVLINTQITPNSFTHNVWVTSDDHYAVTTDEIAGAYLTLYDVSNPGDIRETDRIRSSPGESIIPHNAFIVRDSLIISSYYTDGITIHDMTRPHNLVQIGGFDTNPLATATFNGSWGTYPFLPSGLILASDIEQGLFVLHADLISAAWYEGLVRDASNLSPLTDVLVAIDNNPQTDLSNALGAYGVGTVTTGVQNVTFSKVAYYPQTIAVDFSSGVLVLDTIDLVPIPPFALTVVVQEQGTGTGIIGADVRIEVPEMVQDGPTNGLGEHNFQLYYPGNSIVTVGKWGYRTKCAEYVLDASTGTITVQLQKGYYDDFSFDFGWTTIVDGATTGLWERGIPNPVSDNASPPVDALYDCDRYAYVTGNLADEGSDADDVDGGRVSLYSPLFDATTYTDPHLYYQRWFFCEYGPGLADDTLTIYLSNGSTQVKIDSVYNTGFTVDWVPRSYRIADFLTPTANMQLMLTTADEGPNVNVTEAAIDAFSIDEQSILGADAQTAPQLTIYPNPVQQQLTVLHSAGADFSIVSPAGITVMQGFFPESTATVPVAMLAPGIYFLRVGDQIVKFVKE